MIHPGLKIDGLVIEDELGRGGFGSVYLAREEATGKPVAIKFLHPKSLNSEESRHAFINEMIHQARLYSCPNIVQVLRSLRYADRIGEHLGMVMEYVEGDPLDLYIQKYRLLPEYMAVPIFLQVLNGIDFAHRAQILHRDLKPGNIMIQPDGVVKIMDFGLSKVVQGSSGASESARAASLNYVAPERLQKKRVDQRSDIYSIGAALFEALTGRPPYAIEAGDWDDARSKHGEGACAGIRAFCPEHSVALEKIVARALAVAVEDRYPDCGGMIADLSRAWRACLVPPGCRPEFMRLIEATRKLFQGGIPAREMAPLADTGGDLAAKPSARGRKAGKPAVPASAESPREDAEAMLFCPDCQNSDFYLDHVGLPHCTICRNLLTPG